VYVSVAEGHVELAPEIEHVGMAADTTVNDPDSVHPFKLTIDRVYVPAAEIVIDWVVAPVDQR
jgi:hypothetical protein